MQQAGDEPQALREMTAWGFPFGSSRDMLDLSGLLPAGVLRGFPHSVEAPAFDVGGVRELVPSAESGVVVPPGDTTSMARESLVLLGSNEKRLAMGRAARDHIIAHFPLGKMVTELESYLEELASSSPES